MELRAHQLAAVEAMAESLRDKAELRVIHVLVIDDDGRSHRMDIEALRQRRTRIDMEGAVLVVGGGAGPSLANASLVNRRALAADRFHVWLAESLKELGPIDPGPLPAFVPRGRSRGSAQWKRETRRGR